MTALKHQGVISHKSVHKTSVTMGECGMFVSAAGSRKILRLPAQQQNKSENGVSLTFLLLIHTYTCHALSYLYFVNTFVRSHTLKMIFLENRCLELAFA